MADPQPLLGQTVSHYRIVESLVAAAWGLSIELRTHGFIAQLR